MTWCPNCAREIDEFFRDQPCRCISDEIGKWPKQPERVFKPEDCDFTPGSPAALNVPIVHPDTKRAIERGPKP